MPSFLYPVFLIGAAAAAIPVLLHLLRNEQAPELQFSAVRLLRGVKVEHAQRRRIRDWLLLALRAAALLLLALAFARPYLPGADLSARAATVIVLDRSASMGLGAAWNTAKREVRAEIGRTPRGEALALVAFDDRPEVIVEPTFDRGALNAGLSRVERGVSGTRYQPALARAVSLLDDADARTGRIVLISDLQGTRSDARLTIPESIRLDVRSVATPVDNVAVLNARRSGDGVTATLRNDTASLARVRVRLDDGTRTLAETVAELPPAEPLEVLLNAPAGHDDLRVSLSNPDRGGLTFDDARWVGADRGPRRRILIVSAPEDRFYLDAALRAADDMSEFDIAGSTVQGLMAALSRSPQPNLVFLVGPRGLDRGGRDALLRYVWNGGKVFLAASDALNEPGFAPLVEGLTISVPHADDPVLTLTSFEARHPLFVRLGPIADAMGAARFTRAWRVRAQGWDVLAAFNDGAPALAERAVGSGRVLFFASDVNRGWNDFPLQSSFVPFVQEVARYLAPPPASREYTPALLPDGVKPALGFVTLRSGQRILVNPDPRESDTTRMTIAQFSSSIRHHGDRHIDSGAVRRRAEAAEAHQSLWQYGLMLMFGTLVVEGLVGTRGRRG